MMKNIFLLILALGFVTNVSFAQSEEFTGDAVLVADNGNSVTIRSSGIHEKRKLAEANAIKSAFYSYLTKGISGLNNDRPLVDPKTQNDPVVRNYINDLVNNRYTVFIGPYQADEKADKILDKKFKIYVNFELYNESLLRDMQTNKIITKSDDRVSLQETNENMRLPTIMIVPRTKENETIKELLDKNMEYRATASKLAQAFLKEGVETKNFDEVYNGIVTSGALAGPMTSDDQILSEASKGVDVVVYMDVKSSTNSNGTAVELSLVATDAATRSTIASTSESSAYFKNTTASTLSALLAEAIVPPFMKQISTSFARNLSRGQGISIRLQLDPSSSADFNTEVGSDVFTTGDLLRLWIRENCKDGRYRAGTQTSTLIIYDQIFIPTQDEGGQFSDVNDFELMLRQELRKNGIGIAKRLMDGNSIIYTILL